MKKVKTIFLGLVALLGLNACIQNNESEERYSLVEGLENESGTDLARDITQMGEVIQFANFGAPNAKTAAGPHPSEADINISFSPWSFSNSWWTRTGEISVTRELGSGLLEAEDRVQFKNSNDAVIQFPLVQSAVSAHIMRSAHLHLEGARGAYWDVTREWDLNAVLIFPGADTSLSINGSVVQNFSAENAAKTASINLQSMATAKDVIFEKQGNGWSRPVSGTITAESEFKKIVVEFSGSAAHVVVEGKTGNYHADYILTL